MNPELEKVYEKLAKMAREIDELRDGYAIINKRYVEALSTLSEMTDSAKEAASRASSAAKFARQATGRAVDAAKKRRLIR